MGGFLQRQRASGRSAYAWCLDNSVNCAAFLKRCQGLYDNAEEAPLDPLHFQELKNQPSDPMIEITYKGITDSALVLRRQQRGLEAGQLITLIRG